MLSHSAVRPVEAPEQDANGRQGPIYLTRRAEFSASHFYHSPALSAEENRRLYGKCNNPHGHGHNYVLEVTVRGAIDSRSGMVMDLKQLKEILRREVIDVLDHRFLNEEVPAFRHVIPTTENLAVEIWHMLAPHLEFCELDRIRLYETPDLFVDYFGPTGKTSSVAEQRLAKD